MKGREKNDQLERKKRERERESEIFHFFSFSSFLFLLLSLSHKQLIIMHDIVEFSYTCVCVTGARDLKVLTKAREREKRELMALKFANPHGNLS